MRLIVRNTLYHQAVGIINNRIYKVLVIEINRNWKFSVCGEEINPSIIGLSGILCNKILSFKFYMFYICNILSVVVHYTKTDKILQMLKQQRPAITPLGFECCNNGVFWGMKIEMRLGRKIVRN